MHINEHYSEMAMLSSSKIGVDGLRVGLDFVSKLVERFECGFTKYWSEVFSLEEGVLAIDRNCHGGWR